MAANLKVPLGFRFVPSEEELMIYYLRAKLLGQDLPSIIVEEEDLYEKDPELYGNNHEAYFFTSRNRKYPNRKRSNRKVGDGFWKVSSSNKNIKTRDNSLIGQKRTLAYFMKDETSKERKTDWVMVEYTIPHSQLPLQDKQLDTWVICKVYLNNREKKTNDDGAIYEDQVTESSSHSIVNDDPKGLTEINGLRQDMVTNKRVRVLLDNSDHVEEQGCMQSSPLCANRDMSPCMEMPSYMPSRFGVYTVQCSPSRLGQGHPDSQPPLALPPGHPDSQPPMALPPPPSAFAGCAKVGPSMSDATLVAPTITPQPDFTAPLLPSTRYAEAGNSTSHVSMDMLAVTSPRDSSTILPRPFDSNLPDIWEILEGIDANPDIKYFYHVEAKLKEALGDSWLEDI